MAFSGNSKHYLSRLLSVTENTNGRPVVLNAEREQYFYFHADRFFKTEKLLQSLIAETGFRKPVRLLDFGVIPQFASLLVADLPIDYHGINGGFMLDGMQKTPVKEEIHTSINGADLTLPVTKDFDIEHQRLPFPDETFAIVLFLEIIEHLITGPTKALQEIARVLKPEGMLVLTTDNGNNIFKLSALLRNRTIYWPYNDSSFGDRHNREYLDYELRQLLAGIGFSSIAIRLENLNHRYPRKSLIRSTGHAALNALSSLPGLTRFKRQI